MPKGPGCQGQPRGDAVSWPVSDFRSQIDDVVAYTQRISIHRGKLASLSGKDTAQVSISTVFQMRHLRFTLLNTSIKLLGSFPGRRKLTIAVSSSRREGQITIPPHQLSYMPYASIGRKPHTCMLCCCALPDDPRLGMASLKSCEVAALVTEVHRWECSLSDPVLQMHWAELRKPCLDTFASVG
jgi:hypothetical protein